MFYCNLKKKLTFILWILLIVYFPSIGYSIHFEKGYVYTDLIKRQNDSLEMIGEFRLHFHSLAGESLKMNGVIGSAYKKLNEDYNIQTFIWSLDIIYTPLVGLKMGLGHKRVNYSPYLFYSESWQDNFLQGLFFEIKESEHMQLKAFVGLHAEDDTSFNMENRLTSIIIQSEIPNNMSLNLGTIQEMNFNGVWQEHPAIWGGSHLLFSPLKGIELHEYYLHEEYQVDRWYIGFINYDNDILLSKLIFDPLTWVKFDLLYSYMLKNIQTFKAVWNQFGKGEHGLSLDFSQHEKAKAKEINIILKSPENQSTPAGDFELKVTYRSIDLNYTPLHMDNGNFDEDRGEDELNDIFSGEEGYIIRFEKGLAYQSAFFIERYQLKEGLIYHNLINDTRKEWRGGMFIELFRDIYRFSVTYRTINFDETYFKNGSKILNGWLFSMGGGITQYFNWDISFIEHQHWVTHNNKFLFRLIFKF